MCRGCVAALAFWMILGSTTPARAADTTETWDQGWFNVESFLGVDGLGRGVAADRLSTLEFMAGYGILDDFAVFMPMAIELDGHFRSPLGRVGLGVFGTPVNTRFVDLDLFLEVGVGGAGFKEWYVMPSLELSLDAHPERLTWGVFLQAGLPIHGRPSEAGGGSGPTFAVATVLGAYWRPHPDHELVVEFDTMFHPIHASDPPRRVEAGGVALGYNVTLSERVELLSQVSADVPQGGDRWGVGVRFGFILSLPGPASR